MVGRVDQRKYARSPISLDVQVRLCTGVLVEGHACNISLNGLFLETERSLPLGCRVKIKMTVSNSADKTDVTCTGVVSRVDNKGVAIALDVLSDTNMAKLCQLIRETAADAVRMEDERERQIISQPPGVSPENKMRM